MDSKIVVLYLTIVSISILGVHNVYALTNSTATPGPTPPNPGSTTIERFCANGHCHTTDVYNNTASSTAPGNYNSGVPSYQSNKIAIMISKACINLIKNHIPNQCLGYDKLQVLDNIAPFSGGQWINDTWYHRVTNKFSYAFTFSNSKFLIMVDADSKFLERSRVITVQSQPFIWINPDDTANNTNTVQHVNRFVSNPCTGAIVAPIFNLVVDTMHYLETGCKTTNFNDVKNIPRKEIPFSFDNPYAQWLNPYFKTSINETGGLGLPDCIHHKCNFKDPYKNW